MPSSANRPENGGISFRVPEEAQGWRLDKALGISAFGHAAAFATVPSCW